MSGEGSEEDIDHGEDEEECGPGGLTLQVSHSKSIFKQITKLSKHLKGRLGPASVMFFNHSHF